jgi:hypothetical protein
VDVRKSVTSNASAGAPPTTHAAGSVQKCATASFGSEQLLRVGSCTPRPHAVDFKRKRRAEDRQTVREIRRAVDRIEHPARTGGRGRGAAHFLGKHLMIGKTLRDEGAEHALDCDVDVGHEIDRPLLVDLEAAAELRHLQVAGTDDRLDGGGENSGSCATQAGSEASRRLHPLHHADFMPPSSALQHVVHEVADRENATAG